MKTKTPKTILRYWLSTDIYRDRIRVEWNGPSGLMTSTASLCSRRFGYKTLVWGYDTPPEHVAELALDCLHDDGEYGVEGCEYMGAESNAQMDAAVEGVWMEVAA